MLRLLPTAVTLLGGALSMVAVRSLELPWGLPMLLLGWLCDLLDGPLARRLHAETEFGAALDWAIDVAVAHALLAHLHAPWWLVLGCAAMQAATTMRYMVWQRRCYPVRRVSGRTSLVFFVSGRILGVL